MPEYVHIKKTDFEIRVWKLVEDESKLSENLYLSEKEMIKLNTIKNEEARMSFLGVRKLCLLFGTDEINYLENGKPMVKNGHISITHSGKWQAVMISDKKEVGIDIELIHPRILKIRDRFLSSEEIELCGENIEKFVLCWSAKEALFKKAGGETVFFKGKQKINKIDFEQNRILMEYIHQNETKAAELCFQKMSEDYVMVYTM